MKILFVIFFILGCKHSSKGSEIKQSSEDKLYNIVGETQHDLTLLKEITQSSINLFQSHFGLLASQIQLDVSGENCLRVGYNFKEKKVKFCDNTNVIKQGFLSKDVIAHEVFHAMFCNRFTRFCEASFMKEEKNMAIHEGIADYFSYVLSNDNLFGENFYTDQPHVRRYQTDFCYNLVSGSHAKGNAIVSKLITHSFGLKKLANDMNQFEFNIGDYFVDDKCFQEDGPVISYAPSPNDLSRLHRYKINKNESLKIKFEVNEAFKEKYPNVSIRFVPEKEDQILFDIVNGSSKFEFVISPKVERGWSKYFAKIVNLDGEVVGSNTFYFSIRNRQ